MKASNLDCTECGTNTVDGVTGKWVTVYGQQEVVKDLIKRRLADGGDVRFECGDVSWKDRVGKATNPREPGWTYG